MGQDGRQVSNIPPCSLYPLISSRPHNQLTRILIYLLTEHFLTDLSRIQQEACRLIPLLAEIGYSEQPWAVTQHPLEQKLCLVAQLTQGQAGRCTEMRERRCPCLSAGWQVSLSLHPALSLSDLVLLVMFCLLLWSGHTESLVLPKHVPRFMDLCLSKLVSVGKC